MLEILPCWTILTLFERNVVQRLTSGGGTARPIEDTSTGGCGGAGPGSGAEKSEREGRDRKGGVFFSMLTHRTPPTM